MPKTTGGGWKVAPGEYPDLGSGEAAGVWRVAPSTPGEAPPDLGPRGRVAPPPAQAPLPSKPLKDGGVSTSTPTASASTLTAHRQPSRGSDPSSRGPTESQTRPAGFLSQEAFEAADIEPPRSGQSGSSSNASTTLRSWQKIHPSAHPTSTRDTSVDSASVDSPSVTRSTPGKR
jgi:hypothetical protein